ncbi:hypothetical protein CI610_00929 [invertebrate metagenome]|uniref:Uncharacterized protein n=1 Tax=invertebrate metagenome TaxID=1711999 RepID=A0A2H9TA14_9ZZZZ
MLEALELLGKQLNSIYLEKQPHSGRPFWLTELPWQTEHEEQEVILRLQRPFLMDRPKESIVHLIQTQSYLAHLIFRTAERLSYPVSPMPNAMSNALKLLCYAFNDACQLLQDRVKHMDALHHARYRKEHARALRHLYQQQALHGKRIETASHQLRHALAEENGSLSSLDSVMLMLTLDDLCEIMGRIRALLTSLQQY